MKNGASEVWVDELGQRVYAFALLAVRLADGLRAILGTSLKTA